MSPTRKCVDTPFARVFTEKKVQMEMFKIDKRTARESIPRKIANIICFSIFIKCFENPVIYMYTNRDTNVYKKCNTDPY